MVTYSHGGLNMSARRRLGVRRDNWVRFIGAGIPHGGRGEMAFREMSR